MIRLPIWIVALGLTMVVAFSACRSMTPVAYYTLEPIAETFPETKTISNQGMVIGILPVDLPGTINRTQMVLRSEPHQLDISSLHRWADYPKQLVQQIIGENLQALMPDTRVVSAPWPMGLKPDAMVSIKFYELIGTGDKKVLLSAVWTIMAGDPSFTQSSRITLTESMMKRGYDELAAAHSRVLAVFCRHLADSLKPFRK